MRSSFLVCITGLAIAASAWAVPLSAASAAEDSSGCTSESGVIQTEDLPEGTDVVSCNLVGQDLVNDDGLAVEIPDPGEGVRAEVMFADEFGASFQVEVAEGGDLSYESDPYRSESGVSDDNPPDEGAEDSGLRLAQDTRGCDNSTYATSDNRRDGNNTTYVYRLGDGARPAGLSTESTLEIVFDALATLRDSTNQCNLADLVDLSYRYGGATAL